MLMHVGLLTPTRSGVFPLYGVERKFLPACSKRCSVLRTAS